MSASVAALWPRDPLSGSGTYTAFFQRVDVALREANAEALSIAVLSVDLDSFHHVSEDHGHDDGETVLTSVGRRLQTALQRHDLVAGTTSTIFWVGADKFLVLCEEVRGQSDATAIATEVLAAIAQPVELASGNLLLSSRVGIALSVRDSTAQQMILDAEAAQRHAKVLGGARQQFFANDLREPREGSESDLVEAMRHGLAKDEFRLVYQPKISLTTNRIVGVEALLRWDRPGSGLIMPADFIPAAELSGVIVPIGEFVLRESFRQAAVWHKAYPRTPVHVAINVSARQFQTALIPMVREQLAETGINPSTVCFELTETTIMSDIEGTIAILDELKGLGFKLSIDDFGTGYSSLEYLHRMPIDELKIDRSFVAGLGGNTVSSAIVASIVTLAQTMNLEVVAEGVETRDQLERARTMGCDFAQGYLIAVPVSSTEIGDYLAAHATGQTLLNFGSNACDAKFTPWVAERVLVVDDAADVRMLARMCLTAASFTVEEAGDGAAALALARHAAPACILLAVELPDLSGIEVCRALREGETTKECAIVLAGRDDRVDKAEAFLAGADDYMLNPFVPRALVARVRSAIDRRRKLTQTTGRQVDSGVLEMLQNVREQDSSDQLVSDEDDLSSRQLEILRRLLDGQRVVEIAGELFISQSTVRNHLSAIYQRFDVHSQVELLSLLRTRAAQTAVTPVTERI